MLTANVLPSHTFESLERLFIDATAANPRATIVSVLRGGVPERLANAIAPDSTPMTRLSREERRQLVRSLTELPLPVIADRGFDYAEVTAGGVPLTEIDAATMASRRCDGLFLCRGDPGRGRKDRRLNFQWAWASGRLAGVHSASGPR